jgi:HlyD family secretion protein
MYTLLIPILFLSLSACATLEFNNSNEDVLSASGTIAAREVKVAAEVGGVVKEVNVEESQSVEAGDILFRLDEELMQAQYEQALAALKSAQVNLSTTQIGVELVRATLNSAKISLETARLISKAELLPSMQALDDLYKTAEVATSETQLAVAASNRAVREAQYRLDNFTIPMEQKGLTAMEAVVLMKERLAQARDEFEPYKYKSSSDPTREDLKEALEEAQSEYDSAVRRLEYEASLIRAEAALKKSNEDLALLQDGPNPDDIAILEAHIEVIKAAPNQAEAAVAQAEVGLTQAESAVNQAEALLEQAQAALRVIEVQLNKTIIVAPDSGIVLVRNIEPGETISPGSTVIVIGQMEDVKLIVYVPEDEYGKINLGDDVSVTIDSFPMETFSGVVVRISDRAEFTPRNVQTEEGRRSTVYAIEILVPNPDGKLKPGMPADVTFTGR